mmetsp:Transcript_103920/g.224312  ORF Transcript_103920/g.224312 Transcript_103920/m.224312 type:complete len:223 (-) Transcript_103920:58-726(-)
MVFPRGGAGWKADRDVRRARAEARDQAVLREDEGPDLRDHPHSEDDHLDLLLVDRVPLAHRDDQLPGIPPELGGACLCLGHRRNDILLLPHKEYPEVGRKPLRHAALRCASRDLGFGHVQETAHWLQPGAYDNCLDLHGGRSNHVHVPPADASGLRVGRGRALRKVLQRDLHRPGCHAQPDEHEVRRLMATSFGAPARPWPSCCESPTATSSVSGSAHAGMY